MSKGYTYPELAEADAKAAVLLMFNHLEGLLKRSFARTYPDEPLPGSVAALTKNLTAKGVITIGLRERLDDLRNQRNHIVHSDPQVTDEEAANYCDSLGTALVELTNTSLFR